MPRGDGGVNESRLAIVEALLRQCLSHAYIERQLAQPVNEENPAKGGFGVSRRTIRRYIKRVQEEWKKRAANKELEDGDFERQRHVEAFGELYARALNGKDYKAAGFALRERGHFLGLYPDKPTKLELGGPDGGAIPVLDLSKARDELAKALERIGQRELAARSKKKDEG